jgi:dephospho-CoA kinase
VPILRVGLTGGIGSGKTTVARMFEEHGAFVVDADAIAHELTAPGSAVFDAIVARFGPAVLASDGSLDRGLLGQRVFADPHERRALEALVHPAVRAEAARRIASYGGSSPLAIFDAALLVETGAHRDCQRVVVVRCSEEMQLRRLLARGLDPAQAQARIAAQASLAEKLAVADHVIDTEGTLEATREQVGTIYAQIIAGGA